MVPYVNARGHDWGAVNLDGYGISLIVFAVLYTLFFLAACAYLWLQRDHPLVRMRKVPLVILSLLLLHIYLFMVFLVYPLNGNYPCNAEFWVMSLYLPVGIGLFQAQNQQLLIISREQNDLLHLDESFKPLYGDRTTMKAAARYWAYRARYWWRRASKQGKFESLVLLFVVVQVTLSIIIFNVSRKFSAHGIVSAPTTPGQCRRGWEWAPSVLWQAVWNYVCGPYLLWRISMINDIYNWRLQTILAIAAGIPGTPLWLASVYTNAFDGINKYWVPAMWFAPGLMVMELTTLVFPIVQLHKHRVAARETSQALAEYEEKRHKKHTDASSSNSGSVLTRSTGSKGRMYSMESLESCLKTNCEGLQVYASCMELNGENIIFLTKVLRFKEKWRNTFSTSSDFLKAKMVMFKRALSIYVTLINSDTANYPINIESSVYSRLELIFGEATALVASCRRGSSSSSSISQVTPWEDDGTAVKVVKTGPQTFQMRGLVNGPTRNSSDGESTKQIIEPSSITYQPLDGYKVPIEFTAKSFDDAYRSIRYMVWSETWQRYMAWKQTSGTME